MLTLLSPAALEIFVTSFISPLHSLASLKRPKLNFPGTAGSCYDILTAKQQMAEKQYQQLAAGVNTYVPQEVVDQY